MSVCACLTLKRSLLFFGAQLEQDEVRKKWSCGYQAIVRIVLANGVYHEDVGYGVATNMATNKEAYEKAYKVKYYDAGGSSCFVL